MPKEVRKLLLEAASRVFAERGFGGATTREIVGRAGVAEPLLFRHFGSKANLFREAALYPFGEFVAEEIRTFEAQRAEPWSNELLMRDFIARLYDVFRRNRRLVLSLIAASELEGLRSARVGLALPGLAGHLARLEKIGREVAAQHDMATVDVEVSSRAVSAMVFAMAVFDRWFGPQGREGPSRRERVVDALTKLALYGVEYQAEAVREGKSAAPVGAKAARSRSGFLTPRKR
jgi:AcrR family transcriptional regulator